MGFKNEVYDVLIAGNHEKAMNMLLSKYEGGRNTTKLIALDVMFSAIKTLVFNDESNRSPSYFTEMGDLLDGAITMEDRTRIYSLTYSTLKRQHYVHDSRKSYLLDGPLDDELKTIKPIISVFYKFDIPQHIKNLITQVRLDKTKSRQNKQIKEKEFYEISTTEAEELVVKSREIIDGRHINTSIDYYNFVAAVGVLSGRRNFEIQRSLGISNSNHPYQAIVDGICKKKDFYEQEFCIPLLCPYDEFEHAMTEIREFKEIPDDPIVASKISSPCILLARKRIFGRRLTHTQIRNIYSQLAWKKRLSENNFMTTLPKHVWMSNALCHDVHFNATDCYNVMTVGESSSP